ncbi:MAG: acyl-ACP--UDP-N-acetylglucosamine O-acyltransferase [Candidatus Neomarinimicrobiota bacterium]
MEVGPFSVIDDNVVVGDDCQIGNHVTLRGGTRLGKGCRVFPGAVIGEVPQDMKFGGEETTTEIGEGVTLREHVTVHRGSKARGRTEMRDHAYIMAYVHVGHDCFVGEHVILTNAVQLGGHVSVDDWAVIGGIVAVHQFSKIGKHSFVGGGFRVIKDVPPYITVAGEPLRFQGINSAGLKRRGFSEESRRNIKQAYHLIYRSSLNTTQALQKIRKILPQSEEIQEIISFAENSERGLV